MTLSQITVKCVTVSAGQTKHVGFGFQYHRHGTRPLTNKEVIVDRLIHTMQYRRIGDGDQPVREIAMHRGTPSRRELRSHDAAPSTLLLDRRSRAAGPDASVLDERAVSEPARRFRMDAAALAEAGASAEPEPLARRGPRSIQRG
jgi:hypothetical protein